MPKQYTRNGLARRIARFTRITGAAWYGVVQATVRAPECGPFARWCDTLIPEDDVWTIDVTINPALCMADTPQMTIDAMVRALCGTAYAVHLRKQRTAPNRVGGAEDFITLELALRPKR